MLYDERLPYPGHYAVVPVLGSALVIAAWGQSVVLGNRLAQILGDTSYSFYLWHWPFIVGARVLEIAFTPAVMVALALLSFGAAMLSHRLVEKPFRTRGTALRGGAYLVRAVAVVAALGGVAAVVYQTRGVPARVPPLAARNDAVSADFVWSDVCGKSLVCAVGPQTPKKVLFWGDSHVEQLFPAAQLLVEQGKNHGKQPLFHAQSACIPVRGFGGGGASARCPSLNAAAHARALADDIDSVVIASIWTPYFREVLYDPATRPTLCHAEGKRCAPLPALEDAVALVRAQMVRDLGELTARGKRVTLVAPVPIFDRDVAQHLAERGWRGHRVELSLPRAQHEALVAPITAMLREVAATIGASLLDPADVLCASGSCLFARDGVSIYRDNSHLAAAAARMLAPALGAAFL